MAPGADAVTFAARIRAYAELSRVSNVPTVASGVLAGTALGAHAHGDPALLGDWRAPLTSALACCGFYVAGMALNDLMDRAIDREERPHRLERDLHGRLCGHGGPQARGARWQLSHC